MKSFYITAVNNKGKNVTETIFAETTAEAKQMALKRGLYVTSSKEIDENTDSVKRINTKGLVIYCQQLSTMMNSGVSLVKALDLIQDKADNRKTKLVYSSVYEEVQKGNTLSLAMMAQRGAFPPLLINMIAAGEKGGTMDKSLDNMADFYTKEAELNRTIKGAAMYPMILLVISTLVVLVLVTFVLPSITSIFDEDTIPWTTKMLMDLSDFLIGYWYIIIAVIVGSIYGIRQALKINTIRLNFDKMKLRIPITGALMRTIYSSRVAGSMASLQDSGVPTLSMLEETGKIIGNKYLQSEFVKIYEKVSSGELLSKAIEECGEFDAMLPSMILIGEESGDLGKILKSTADYFSEEASAASTRLVTLLEPAMILVMGFMVAFIVISIIQPIFQMYDSVA